MTLNDIASFMTNYRLEDNLPEDEQVPDPYRDRLREPLFSAAFPTKAMHRIWT